MARTQLPIELGKVFTVGEARALGVSGSRLRGRDLEAPYRGIRTQHGTGLPAGTGVPGIRPPLTAAEAAAGEIRERARILARTMPESQFFTHVTAAVLWGLPVPASLLRDSFGALAELDVGVLAPLRHPRHVGVRGHQLRPGRVRVVAHGDLGLRLTAPASTWATLGAVIVDEYDLVAVADAAVRVAMFSGDPAPLTTLDQLAVAVRSGRRVGGPALRRALPRVRERSASRMETRCRLILLDAGLPEPHLNYDVFDQAGRFVACVDLAYPDERIAIEYEGEHHLRDPSQWARDIARHEALAAAGWFVIRVTKTDVFAGRAGLIRRVREALFARQ